MADTTLYYFPSSYYSLKALLALYEKDVKFEGQLVNIHGGEQGAEWFLRVNKNGEVPVLKIGDKYVSESEEIINVIDRTFLSGPRLVPDVETGVGREVRDLRKTLQDIPVDVITFGMICNKHLCVKEMGFPKLLQRKFSRESVDKNMTATAEKYKKDMETCPPELKQCFQDKLSKITNRHRSVMNEAVVKKCLDDLEGIFDRLAARLDKSKKEAQGEQDVWIFGRDVTAVDISTIILMFRLEMIGIGARFFSPEVRPGLHDYYIRMSARAPVQKMFEVSKGVAGVHMRMAMKAIGVKVVKVGLVVGVVALCYMGYKEFNKSQSLART